jgi:hypothetical protein
MTCSHLSDPRHTQPVGGASVDCAPKKGVIWAQVLDDKGAGVAKVSTTIAGKVAETDSTGFGYGDPLDENTYDVEVTGELPEPYKDTHLLPEKVKAPVPVNPGDIKLVKFRLDRINVVTPKIEVEYKVVLFDRGLATYQQQASEPEADWLYPDGTRIEVSLTDHCEVEIHTRECGSFPG